MKCRFRHSAVVAAVIAAATAANTGHATAENEWTVAPSTIVTGKASSVAIHGPNATSITQLYLEPGGWPVAETVTNVAEPMVENPAVQLPLAKRLADKLGSTSLDIERAIKRLVEDCNATDGDLIARQWLVLGCGATGIQLFDITNPAEPRWRSSHSQLGAVKWIRAASDDMVIAIDDRGAALVIDVSNPLQPLVDYSFHLAVAPTSVSVVERALIVSDGKQTLRYPLKETPPRYSNENLNGGEGVNFGGQRRGVVVDNTLYVADWFSGIHIYDVTQPQRPKLLSSYHTPGSPKGIVVRNHIAYVADDDHGLQLVDVNDPRHPTSIATITTGGLAYTPIIDGKKLYLASHRGGFQIFDLSDERAPTLLSETKTPGKAWSLAIKDSTLFVADSEGGVLVYDARDAREPKLIGTFAPGGNAEDIVVDGERAYVAFFDDGVYVLDVKMPESPAVLSHIATNGNARGVVKQGESLWIADWLAGIHRYDVTVPTKPRLQTSYDTPGAAWGMRVVGDVVYVFDWWSGLRVLSGATTERLAPLSAYNQDIDYAAFAGRGRYLYAAQHDRGVQVFDIKNPLNPTWINGIELGGDAIDIAINGATAYVAMGAKGLVEVDAGNPFQLQAKRPFAMRGEAHRVRAAGQHVAVADRRGRVELYRVDTGKELVAPIARFQGVRDTALSNVALYVVDNGGRLNRVALAPLGSTQEWLRLMRVRSVRADDKAVIALTEDNLLLRVDDQHPERVIAQLSPSRKAKTLALDGQAVYLTTDDGVVVVDISAPTTMREAAFYPLNNAPTDLTSHGPALYGNGSDNLLAMMPLPFLTKTADASNGQFAVPARLPEGAYNLRFESDGSIIHLNQALRVEGLQLR